MAVLLGVMVYLGALALAGQALLSRAAQTWSQDLEGRFTLEVSGPQESAGTFEDAVFHALEKLPGVARVARVSETEMRDLLRSWTGEAEFADGLPLPVLFDLEVYARQKPLNEQALAQALRPVGAVSWRLHTHVGQAAPLVHVVRGLEGLAVMIALLTGLALVGVSAIACHAVLSAQTETISLLRILGAENGTIATAFQRHVWAWSAPACGIGFILAVATLVGAGLVLGAGANVFSFSVAFLGALSFSMALSPVCAVVLAVVTARVSVFSLLRRSP